MDANTVYEMVMGAITEDEASHMDANTVYEMRSEERRVGKECRL